MSDRELTIKAMKIQSKTYCNTDCHFFSEYSYVENLAYCHLYTHRNHKLSAVKDKYKRTKHCKYYVSKDKNDRE